MNKWEKNVRKVVPYVPGEQPDNINIIKLNTNENPYPPSENVLKAISEIDYNNLRLYPDPTCNILVKAIAEYYNISDNQVFTGIGSDDVLAMAFLTFFNSDKPILFPDITYSFYDVWAELFGIPYLTPELDNNFFINPEDYKKENGGIIFPNPNAPTGLYQPLSTIEDIVKYNSDVIVIIDEAYIDFGGESAIKLIDKYDNLLIVQTFSKSRSMAGMRIGFAIGSPILIKYLNDAKYSFNSYTMNQTALNLGAACIKDKAHFNKTVKKIIDTREMTKKQLAKIGFSFPDSMANFIFARHKDIPAKELFLALKQNNIFVRYFDKPRINNFLRITIGTDEEMNTMINFLKNYINKLSVRQSLI